MPLPHFIRKLFSQNGFGSTLNPEIIPDLDASKIKTGKLHPNVIPDLAYNVLYRVDSEQDMVMLTTNEVQNNDFTLVAGDRLYMVVDENNLNNVSKGYLFLLSLKNLNSGGISHPINISLTGDVTGVQENWDGSTDIEIETTIASEAVLNKVVYLSEDTIIEDSNLGNILCIISPIDILIPKIDINGWNCYLKNLTDNIVSISGQNTDIDNQSSFDIAPECTIKLISNGDNYITIDTTPRVILK